MEELEQEKTVFEKKVEQKEIDIFKREKNINQSSVENHQMRENLKTQEIESVMKTEEANQLRDQARYQAGHFKKLLQEERQEQRDLKYQYENQIEQLSKDAKQTEKDL